MKKNNQEFNWGNFKKFVNRRKTFTRQQMLEYFGIADSKQPHARSHQITADNYRNYLRAAEYLETTGRGKYKVLAKVNPKRTVTEIKEFAYGKEVQTF